MAALEVVYVLLYIFWFCLIGRVIVEFIRSFARDWHPKGILVVLLEVLFTITDPPVKLLRKLIPPVRMGQVRLDLSILVLMLILFVLISIVGRFMYA
ncbi:YggT family protein [Tomitella cavernea]|uniref:YggT family protein n=1 Tax=Tomitella cavernea TaxID=1387982 RepID=A0ABP9CSM4_9ACTN|nr:YggT family protein [Tomitella cavernea]